jgi:hypothetical protein
MTLKTRKPTGAAMPPIVLVVGETDSGKSVESAKFTGSDKVGRSFWFQIGKDERTADWYGRVEGANYDIVEHDGTWPSIMEAARDVAAEAEKEFKKTGKVPTITVDSMNGEWKMLSRFAEWKARNSKASRRILAQDPNADITVGSTCWNAATKRHDDFLDTLADSPAIIVLICRSNLVTEFDKSGQPLAGQKTWSIQGQKNLLGYADIGVQLHLTEDPELLKLKSVENGIIPGKNSSRRLDGAQFSLEWLVFERYGLDPQNMARREVQSGDANMVMPGEEVSEDDSHPRPPRGGRPQPTAEELDEIAKASVASILAAGTREATTQQWREANGSPARDVDVSKYLTVVDRETLGMGEQEQIVLVALAERVGRYVAKHGRAVQATAEGAPVEAQTEAAAA